MDASNMVIRLILLSGGVAVGALLASSALYCHRNCSTDEILKSGTLSVRGYAADSRKPPLSEDDSLKCSLAFQEMSSAYSNQRYEEMERIYCDISNKVSGIGMENLDKTLGPMKAQSRELFLYVNRGLRDFTNVSDFERYMKTNIAAVRIVGCAIAENNAYDTILIQYDMAVFRAILSYLEKFNDNGNQQLSAAAKSFLDEWKDYLSSGESFTRIYLRHQFLRSLKHPRWLAEDMGMKSAGDWVASSRDYALKFHEQMYGIVPKWLDEEFPLGQERGDVPDGRTKVR